MEKKTIVCLSCHKTVEVKLIPYGWGHIASCPLCDRLAYSKSLKAEALEAEVEAERRKKNDTNDLVHS